MFVLSPHLIINEEDEEIIICKDCLLTMERNYEQKHWRRNFPPVNSICNGYLIGQAPKELQDLNDVELTLVSKDQTYCQTWVFKGGIHQQIKGWHTFFKNCPGHHVASLQQLDWTNLKGNILVVLCGPFTKTQKAMTMQKILVDPDKVIKAYQWLVENNHLYKDDQIPSQDEIPIPQIYEENV